jgi:Uma2 family endonuclease
VRYAVGRKALVSVQNLIAIGPHSEPQPDIALLKRREDFYKSARPHPVDVLLIIEVAGTSLAYDRDLKLPLDARLGIPEVWIVDLENRCLHVFTGAAETGYQQTQTLAEPAVRTLRGVA